MPNVGKNTISSKILSTTTDKSSNTSWKTLVFAHKFTSAGLTDIDLTNLTVPTEMSLIGFVPSDLVDLQKANMYFCRNNIRLVSSSKGVLQDWVAYNVVSNTLIRLLAGHESEVGEIITGYVVPVQLNGLMAVDATAVIQTGTLAAGSTDIVVGDSFTYNKYSNYQIGDVMLFIDGEQQFRNIGNISTGEGNYYEVSPASGYLSKILRLNIAPGTIVNYAVVSTGLVAERPTASVLAKWESLAGQMDQVIQDLAQTLGNPISRYQTVANTPDLAVFGNLVKSFISGVHYDAVVGSAVQFAALQCTHTSIQAAHDAVAAGSKILVLQGTYVENLSISKKILIEGKGHSSYVSGTLTMTSSSDYSCIKNLRFGDNITLNSGADGIFLRECWLVNGKTLTDNGSGNSILVIGE